ncbi:MAG TPA: STAS domain-containing protein [Candidatus Binatia bacterium]|nr:STAS domain-containing protein [Candidatus Binatia bacterium]
MALIVRNQNGITILTPSGMLLGGKETDEFEEKITELDKAGDRMLALDMSQTTFMTSIAIAAVVRAHISYSKRGAQVKICGLDKHIRHIFAITKLDCVFRENLHDTLEQGLAGFRGIAPGPAGAEAPRTASPAIPRTASAA